MGNLRLFHLSDLHIGVRNQILGERGHLETVVRELGKIVRKAEDEGVKFVVIAGDIFDSNAVVDSYVKKFFKILGDHSGVNFVLIPGGGERSEEGLSGHDAYVDRSVYRRPEVVSLIESMDNVYLLTPRNRVVNIEDVVFSAGFFDLAPIVKEGNYRIAVMHGAYGGRSEFNEIPLTSEFLSSFDYVALGHYHTHSRLAENAAYSGALVQFEFIGGKSAIGGCLDVEISNGKCEIRFIESDSPGFEIGRVLSEEDLSGVVSLLKQGSMVRISSYLEDFEDELVKLKSEFGRQLLINDAGKIERNNFPLIEVLTELLDEVPAEYRDQVEDIILFGLFTSPTSKEFESFLKEKFKLEE